VLLLFAALPAPAGAEQPRKKPHHVEGSRGGAAAAPLARRRLALSFRLTTQRGEPFTPADLEGRPFALFFGFTHCPEVCPTTLLEMSNHLASLGRAADRLTVLFVTVDPARDTPSHLGEYMASFDPRIVALSGDPIEIAALAQDFRAHYQRIEGKDGNYAFNHSAGVFLVDREGVLVDTIHFQEREPDQRVKLLRLLLPKPAS
jgi:protein SCO1/2